MGSPHKVIVLKPYIYFVNLINWNAHQDFNLIYFPEYMEGI